MTSTLTGRPVLFGEVLFDCFPDGQVVLGGAPFNVAWHLNAFGASPLLVTRIGADDLGERIRATMDAHGMDTAGLQLDPQHPTGTVQVEIEDDEPRYDIVKPSAWDFIEAGGLPAIDDAALLYHGSLAVRSPVSREALERLRAMLAAPAFVDINLRPPWWEAEAVRKQLEGARWIKLNEDELRALTPEQDDLAARADRLRKAPGLELLIITLGAAGAVAHGRHGESVRVEPPPGGTLVDTVGAGDAFASVIMLGLLKRWELEPMLQRAQAFSSAIVAIRGATPDDKDFYTPFLKDWKLT